MARNMFVVLKRKELDDGTWGEETGEILIDGRFNKPFVTDEADVAYTYKEEIEAAGGREAVEILLHPFR